MDLIENNLRHPHLFPPLPQFRQSTKGFLASSRTDVEPGNQIQPNVNGNIERNNQGFISAQLKQ